MKSLVEFINESKNTQNFPDWSTCLNFISKKLTGKPIGSEISENDITALLSNEKIKDYIIYNSARNAKEEETKDVAVIQEQIDNKSDDILIRTIEDGWECEDTIIALEIYFKSGKEPKL